MSVDEHVIHRIRDKNFNGYEIENEESSRSGAPLEIFEAIKSEVPDSISEILKMEDVNIHRQHDAPFLLSETSAEVARVLNAATRLDVIDRILGLAESKKRKTRQDLQYLESSQAKLNQGFENLSWLDDAEAIIDKAERQQRKIEAATDEKSELTGLIEQYLWQKDNISYWDVMISASNSIEKAEAILSQNSGLDKEYAELRSFIYEYDQALAAVSKYKNIDAMIRLIDQAQDVSSSIIDDENAADDIGEIIDDYEAATEDVRTYAKTITENQKLLPNTCPLCGSKI